MNSSKFARIFLPLLVLVIAGSLAAYLVSTRPERQSPQPVEKVWQVSTIAAKQQALSPGITIYGRVESPDLLKAAAPGPGIVHSVKARAGDSVDPGQSLVALDSRDFDSKVIQAGADLKELESQVQELRIRHQANLASLETEKILLELAEAEVRRMQELKNKNLGAETALNQALGALERQRLTLQVKQFDVDSFPARLQMLESQHTRAQSRLADARRQRDQSEVIAGFRGIVNTVPVSAGDRVAAGQTLITLYPLDGLEVRAHIPSSYINDLQAALQRGESPRAVIDSASGPREFRLVRLAGEAAATGTDAYFQAVETDHLLRPGALLSLRLSLPVEEEVFPIPFQSVYGNSRIYLLRDDRLTGVDVETVGQLHQPGKPSLLLVKSPLIKDGDLIVTTHLPNAVTGLKVKTVEP